MTGKQARGLFQALFVSLSVAVASAQATKNSTVVAPTPSPSPAAGAKTNLPAATERKAGGETGTLSCNGKPAVTKTRKAGGDPAINPCFKPAAKSRKAGGDSSLQPCFNKPASTMRKAGGEQQALCTNEKVTGTPEMRKAGGDPHKTGSDAGVVIAIRPSSSLNGDGKTANSSKARKAGGDGGIIPCIKPSGKKSGQTGGTTGLNGDGKTGLNGDGKTAKTNMRKAGGDGGVHPCIKPADNKSRKAGGQGIVRPNCSSATKGISGSTGGAPKPDVPQTPVPK